MLLSGKRAAVPGNGRLRRERGDFVPAVVPVVQGDKAQPAGAVSRETMLQVDSLCKTYAMRPPYLYVLQNITFTIEEGSFVSLLGPSGCGKTTLLTLVGGFHKPSSGKMFIKGREIRKPGPDRGFVFQNYALFPWLTVSQNVQYPMKERGVSKRERKGLCARLLDMAQLQGTEDRYPSQLSGGMKQRLAFIRALAGAPDILLLDEPLGAIDPQMRKTLQVELENLWLQDKKTVLMVTHDIDEAVYLSDRILIMAPSADETARRAGSNIIAEMEIGLRRPHDRKSAEYRRALKEVEQALETIGSGNNNRKPESGFAQQREGA